MNNKHLIAFLSVFVLTVFFQLRAQTEQNVITVEAPGLNDCESIRVAVSQVKALNGVPCVIKFSAGTYHLRRTQATPIKYYISNTMSWSSTPDNMKYIGIYLKGLSNVLIDATEARFVTHGEITSLVMDGCEKITIKNLVLDAADPSLTEMTVEQVIDSKTFVFKAHETSNFEISGTTLRWKGEGWSFTGGPAQIYDPIRDISWRSWNPQSGIQSISALDSKRLRIVYDSDRDAQVGYTFQMRDGVRDQVAGLILKSKNIILEGVKLHFLGNFGVVCQYSDGLTFSHCDFSPDPQSGRTSAGFADFLQVSGCKGVLKVEDCTFQGAHDDPINVHGTYLKVVEYASPTKVKVRFEHHESWGFEAFFVGDKIELIDASSMLSIEERRVVSVTRVDDRNIYVEFDASIDVNSYSGKTIMLENVTWTPEVEIRRCHFSRVPTRGVLLTTRGRSVIEDNTFYKMQMAGIYVSGDASSWFESGKVTDLTIRRNQFVECGSPVIFFDPTNSVNGGQVHSNVSITDNEFYIKSGQAVGGKSVKDLTFSNNTIYTSSGNDANRFCSLSQSANISSVGNMLVNPSQISLRDATCTASSSQVAYPAYHLIDGKTSTIWRPELSDQSKSIVIRLSQPSDVNRIQIVPNSSVVLKYRIMVSTDSVTWRVVLDCSDNTESVASRSTIGCFGRSIQFVRIEFQHTIVNISEIQLFGGSSYLDKERLLSGAVMGTLGSWNGVLEATRDAVFDFDTETFFDAPSSTGWVGLDFGKGTSFRIDSILFAPRSTDEGRGRMVGGRFELANKSDFSDAVSVYIISAKPNAGYQRVLISDIRNYRYGRYVSPDNGFVNISELEFYGSYVSPLGLSITTATEERVIAVRMDGDRDVLLVFPRHWSGQKEVKLYSMSGRLLKIFRTSHSELCLDRTSVNEQSLLAHIDYRGTTQSLKVSF